MTYRGYRWNISLNIVSYICGHRSSDSKLLLVISLRCVSEFIIIDFEVIDGASLISLWVRMRFRDNSVVPYITQLPRDKERERERERERENTDMLLCYRRHI